MNDDEDVRSDALLATLAGKADPSSPDRARERDRGQVLAGEKWGFDRTSP